MRQFEWDKSLEELCSSEQEVQDLKEVASMFCDMQKTESSSSFRDSLKNNLLKNEKVLKIPRRKLFTRPLFATAAAAAVLVIIALSVFSNPRQIDPKITSPGDYPPLEIAQVDPLVSELDLTPGGEEDTNEQPNVDVPGNGKIDPVPEVSKPKDNTSGDPGSSATHTPIEDSLKEEPEFEAWRNEKSFKLAGNLLLSPVYYNVTAEEGITPSQNVNYNWKPSKTVVATGVAGETVGSKAWARELLLNEGFMPSEADYLRINSQETQKGLFVEVFYRDLKSSGLTLVLHFQEGKGILAYYYEDMGEAKEAGFYPILSPSKAFEQAKNLEWFGPTQRLNFSFQEVTLTYHLFTIEENGVEKSIKLPAYCFLGMETFNNGGVLKVYLPAVK
ncbi:MAG: hypothetical protein Q7J85_05105 [Bacillota bacterium]|nr:hypothetical protein [Bacillota bacterium]